MRWLLLLVMTTSAAAQPAPGLDRMQHRVLDGQFSMRLPRGMRITPNAPDSVGLTLPREIAARAALDEEHGRFVMTAIDTMTFVDGDFLSAVKAELAATNVAASRVEQIKGPELTIVTVEPELPRTTADPNLVHAAYVKTPDRQVVVFAFYLFGDDFRTYAESWARVAADAITSLAYQGDPPARDIVGTMMGGDEILAARVPNGWFVFGLYAEKLRTEGLWLRERVALGQASRTCKIDRSLSTAPARRATTTTRWLGKTTFWRTWQSNSDYQAEIEVKFGDQRVRAWCTARSAAGLREAQRIVAEMTVQ